jgi:hypothetical protein
MTKADTSRPDIATEIGNEIEKSDTEITANLLTEVLIVTASVAIDRPIVESMALVGIMDHRVEGSTALVEVMETEIGNAVMTGEDQADMTRLGLDLEGVTKSGVRLPRGEDVKLPQI